MESKAPNFFWRATKPFLSNKFLLHCVVCVCVRFQTSLCQKFDAACTRSQLSRLLHHYFSNAHSFTLYLLLFHSPRICPVPFFFSLSLHSINLFLIQFKFHIIAIYYEFAFPPTLLIHPNRPHAVTRAANPILFIVGIRCYQPTQTRTRATDRRKGKAAAGFD